MRLDQCMIWILAWCRAVPEPYLAALQRLHWDRMVAWHGDFVVVLDSDYNMTDAVVVVTY